MTLTGEAAASFCPPNSEIPPQETGVELRTVSALSARGGCARRVDRTPSVLLTGHAVRTISRGRAVVARVAHNHKVAGSIPAPATNCSIRAQGAQIRLGVCAPTICPQARARTAGSNPAGGAPHAGGGATRRWTHCVEGPSARQHSLCDSGAGVEGALGAISPREAQKPPKRNPGSRFIAPSWTGSNPACRFDLPSPQPSEANAEGEKFWRAA